MSMNTVTSSGSLSIDRLLGDAYFTVKAVRDHLEDITKVATLLEDISSSVDGLEATRDQIFIDHIAVLVAGLNHYVDTRVAGILEYDVGQFFVSDETGSMRVYKRIPQAPFYEDQGDFLADAIETIVYNTTGHTIGDIQGLQAALDAKANQSHTHTPEQIIGLAALLAEKLELSDLSQPGLLLPGSDYRNIDASRVATSRSYPAGDPKTSKSAFAWRSADGAGGHYEFVMNGDGDFMVPGSIFVGVPEYAVWHQGNFEPSDFYTKTAADSRFLQLTGFTWAGLAGKPSTFTPSAHTHSIAEVLGLQTALDGKQAVGSYAAAVHTHAVGDVANLQAALDSKLNSSAFTWANLSGKPTNVSAFANDAGYITYAGMVSGNAGSVGNSVTTNLSVLPTGVVEGQLTFQRYDINALNKPATVDNANGVITMISHPLGGNGFYGKQIAFADNDDLYIRYLQNGAFGAWRTIWHSGSPTISAVNDLRAPLLYDSDNTAFYINAAGTSNINVLSGNGKTIFETSDGFLRLNQWNSFDGGVWLGPSHLGMNGWLHLGSNGNPNNARIQINPGVYNGSNSISVDGGTGNITGSGTVQAGADVRAPIFYDSSNTGFYTDPAGTSNLNFLTVGGGDVYRSAWVAGFQSQSDFVDGTLVATDIVANVSSGDSFLIEITGKSYSGSNPPFKVIAQGYIYYDTFISCSGISYGGEFPSSLKVLEQDGVLKIWWARLSYWNSFDVRVVAVNGPTNGNITRNRVTGITNSAEPAVSKKVTINLGSFVRSDIAASNSVDLRAPIFYDVNNTLFFTDPSSTSRMAYINLNGLNNPQGFRVMDLDGPDYTLLRGPDSAIRFYVGRDNVPTYYDNDAHYFRTDGGAITQMSITGNGNAIAYVDMRAPVFYDNSDTSFYLDAAGNSVLNGIFLRSSGTTNVKAAVGSYFGYSAGYKTVVLGGDSMTTISMGVDVSGNASGSFNGQGDGREVIFRNGVQFITPNAANNSYHAPLGMVDGYVYSAGSVRAPVFYDNDDTGYYVNPNSASLLVALGLQADEGLNVKGIRGGFSAGSDGQGIHLFSNVDIGYPSGWGVGLSNTPSRGLSVYGGGRFSYGGSGFLSADTSVRAPVFYDSDDTGYYVNPNSTSNLYYLNVLAAGPNTGSYNQPDVFRIYMADPNWAYGSYSNNSTQYWMQTQFYGVGDDSRGFRVLDKNGNVVRFRVNGEGSAYASSSFRAPLFYDSSNSGYYLDPAAGSNLYTVTVASEMFLAGRAVRRPDSLRYMEFTVGGDANTYYPVLIQNPLTWFEFAKWSITRSYADTAPWDPIGTGVHRGGLTFTWCWSGDGAWGGNDKSYRVEQFAEQYTTMVAGMSLSVNGMIVWLRGGGAYYRLHSPSGMDTTVAVNLTTYTASNGATFAPRSYDAATVNTEIMSRFPIRNNGQGGELWDGNTRVLSEDRWINSKYFGSNGAIHGGTFYDASNSAFYVDPAGSSYLNTVNAGIIVAQSSNDAQLYLNGNGTSWAGIAFTDVSGGDYLWYNGSTSTFAVGGGGATGTNKKLHVNGGATVGSGLATSNVSANGLLVEARIDAPIFYDSDNTGYYLDASSGSTSLNVAGSIVAAGNITAYSDIRVKTNVEPIQAALAKLFGISGVTYNRTDLTDKSKRHAGLIAQEVQEVLPEAVIDAGDKKAVDYNAVVGLLVESIKELKREVDTLKSEKGMVP